ncbi:pyrroline-5-carboxylate reductase [Mycobacterium montefiorense]|uniref:Pyrroline-5-carboxylate reductase n=3 Tax=Mycobacterium montefiorense TaxID=154654 RepID=A0AA37PNZ5_9MYCO|nr:pyrroline-5-carboxylate reductase [Mycobacterium montefiorense]GKU37975.1 pyrroline-5-carboxylate reductase [Mycobacterium montefiorense]GKU39253.1 pyrroline-5-carboxylate reductase [Mycobacterium montefiorense]GKU44758.1 pyrroline-5-carboxylate reductase [Mycobacterium montefiorense]GKU53821.1 pyrroline-5-carboxylate reductase [Mycobacterium montefiorense]
MLSPMARIAIIGGGSIGEALLSGLLRAGRQVKDLVVSERVPERAKYLADTYSVLVTSSLADAVEHATFVVVAVKPADVESLMGELARVAAAAEDGSAEQVFVTVAAGITVTYFESKLPAGTPVVRAMPNAAAVVGAGVTALAKGRFVTGPQLEEVSALFEAVGGVLSVPESQMDAVTALSGSGPAYFFLMVEALVDAGVAAGLSRDVATGLTAQTMAGSAALLLERLDQERGPAGSEALGKQGDTAAAQLRATVTSPGGTTAAALRELERGGLRTAVDAAVQAAKKRSEQLRITSE